MSLRNLVFRKGFYYPIKDHQLILKATLSIYCPSL